MRPPARSTRSSVMLTSLAPASTIAVKLNPEPDVPISEVEEVAEVQEDDTMAAKKVRHRMTNVQLERLEALFMENTHPSRQVKQNLADDVGMHLKTVTIWFQNKRQTARRRRSRMISNIAHATNVSAVDQCSKENARSKAGVLSRAINLGVPSSRRPPLATILRTNSNLRQPKSSGNFRPDELALAASSEVPNLSVSTPGLEFSPVQPAGQILPHDLWKYLPSSPPSPSRDLSPETPSPTSRMWNDAGDVFGTLGTNDTHDFNKRKRNLDWACARMAKRTQIETRSAMDEGTHYFRQSKDGNLTDNNIYRPNGPQFYRSNGTAEVVRGGQAQSSQSALAVAPKPPVHTSYTHIPPGYDAIFAPDVVLGASLLLEFKYSEGLPSSTGI